MGIITDHSDWIITIPLADAKKLFPTFTDGVNVKESVAQFNSMLLDRVQATYPGSWVNQERREGFDVSLPTVFDPGFVKMFLQNISRDVYDSGDWYVT